MKRIFHVRYQSFVIALLIAGMLGGCMNNERASHDTYTCPMHPTVISDRPGTCQVCGMDLVRKARPGEEVKITEDLSQLIKSPNEMVMASISTVKGEYKSLPITIQAQGVITYDTRNIFTIPARVGGRLEKVYLKYAFQQVTKGQKIAEIYSPELITAQRELLFLLGNDESNNSLINAAKKKLALLGMSASQISELIDRKEARNTFTVYSPYSGYVITGSTASANAPPANNSTSGGMGDGMGAAPSSSGGIAQQIQSPPAAALVRDGDYVTAGQTLFTIVNNNALRIELDVQGSYSGNIKEGNEVELSLGNRRERAQVDFVQPFFANGQDFLKIRVYTNQTQGLNIGSLVKADVHLPPMEALWVPKEAVVILGVRNVVFIKDRGIYKPRVVTTGIIEEGVVEIKSGLASSDEIASNAQFLVDSESFIRVD